MYNPLAVAPRPRPSASAQRASALATSSAETLLDPSLDVGNMAPSTLILTLRKQRREAKRQQRSEARRSNLRASTLKTEQEVLAKEQQAAAGGPSRKGRRAQHEGGEVRGVRPMTQDELIAQALEEEERNKEELRTWLRREEEKRELRRVGRKVVRGPKWTWVSRTVGKLVEVVGEPDGVESAARKDKPPDQPEPPSANQAEKVSEAAAGTPPAEAVDAANEPSSATEAGPATSASDAAAEPTANPPVPSPDGNGEAAGQLALQPSESTKAEDVPVPTDQSGPGETANVPAVADTPAVQSVAGMGPEPADKASSIPPSSDRPGPEDASSSKQPMEQANSAAITDALPQASQPAESAPATMAQPGSNPAAQAEDAPTGPYARNYLMLSQVAGGLASELKIILGDHVDWDDVKYIPARNRPMSEYLSATLPCDADAMVAKRPAICPFTGRPAKYRHPETMIPYATPEGYKQIEALLQQRYCWSAEANCWFGGEADAWAEGMDEIDGWAEAVNGGWWEGKPLPEPETAPPQEQEIADVDTGEAEAGEGGTEAAEAMGFGRKRKAGATSRTKGRKRSSVLPAEDAVKDVEVLSSPAAATSSPVPSKNSKGRVRASRR